MKLERWFFRITSSQRIYACHQFPHCKWLWQIIICPKSQPGNTVLDLAASGKDQNAAGDMLRVQTPQDFKPVHPWQDNIQENQIEGSFRRCIQSSFAVMDDNR